MDRERWLAPAAAAAARGILLEVEWYRHMTLLNYEVADDSASVRIHHHKAEPSTRCAENRES